MTTKTTSPPSATGRSLRLRVVIDKSMRLAAMLVIVAVGLVLLLTYREILRDSPAESGPPVRNKAVSALEVFDLPELLQVGSWSLGESNWHVQLWSPMDPSAEARLSSLGFRGEIEGKPSALEAQILHWLGRSKSTVVEGCNVYDLPVHSVRLRAVARKQGKTTRLQLVQILWRQGTATQLLEAMPMPAYSTNGDDVRHLLTLPQGVPSLARHWTEAGQLSCEILGPTTDVETCIRFWADAGWSVKKGREMAAPFSYLILEKDGRKVHLCTLPGTAKGSSAYLLLSISPTKNEKEPSI